MAKTLTAEQEAKAVSLGFDLEALKKLLAAAAQYGPMIIGFILSLLAEPPKVQAAGASAHCLHECNCQTALYHSLLAAQAAAECCCDCCAMESAKK